MKSFFLAALACMLLSCHEQERTPSVRPTLVPKDSGLVKADSANPFAPVDLSPMDMSYFPEDYPILKMTDSVQTAPVMRVIYSRPHKQNRKIFGGLLKYGEPWRLGANEASEIEFFRNVTIQGKKVAKGSYVIYAIPYADHWIIALNTNLHSWGLTPHPKDDVARFEIPVEHTGSATEYFSMVFRAAPQGADLLMAWDTELARLPIQF